MGSNVIAGGQDRHRMTRFNGVVNFLTRGPIDRGGDAKGVAIARGGMARRDTMGVTGVFQAMLYK